jgi:hypothetical protein
MNRYSTVVGGLVSAEPRRGVGKRGVNALPNPDRRKK